MRSRNAVKGIRIGHRDGLAPADGAGQASEADLRSLRSDLHDSIGPLLSAVTMRTEAVRAVLAQDPAAAEKMLGELHADARHALDEVRRLAGTGTGRRSEQADLASALNRQADRFTRASNGRLNVSVTVTSAVTALPGAIGTGVYRIASEALTNTARHAMASSCTVKVWADDGAVHVEITDDGIGLSRRPGRGVGLRSMGDRARRLGGTCTVESTVPRGTRVHAMLPLHLEA